MTDEKEVNRGIAKRMLMNAVSRIERELAETYDHSIYMNAVRPAEGTDPALILVEDAVATEVMRTAIHLRTNLDIYRQALDELEAMED